MKIIDVTNLSQKQLDAYLSLSASQNDGLTEVWLEAGANANVDALISAIENDNEELARKLIETGIDINTVVDYKPLLFYVLDDIKWLNLFIEYGVNVETKDIDGMSAIRTAYYLGEEAIVDRLIEFGININGDCTDYEPILIACIEYEEGRWLDKFIEASKDVNVCDDDGVCALAWAVKMNNEEAVDKLIAAGADVNSRDYQGATPLMQVRTYSIAMKLIANGADVNITSCDNDTALTVCLGRCLSNNDITEYEKIIQLLLESGGDTRITTDEGYTALKLARKSKHKNLIKLIKTARNK